MLSSVVRLSSLFLLSSAFTLAFSTAIAAPAASESLPQSPVVASRISEIKKADLALIKMGEAPADVEKFYPAMLWKKSSEKNFWTAQLLTSIRQDFEKLEKAYDIADYCPGYREASKFHQEVCWMRLMSGIMRYESGFSAKTEFLETDVGSLSIGLFSLSAGECELTARELTEGAKNIACGVKIFAELTAVAQGIDVQEKGQREGAAAYWSVLREAYEIHGYILGKRKEIQALTAKYLRF